ncbi:MAG TPA: hemolysin family protein [Devosiaceae bacterium]|nr:hemolysin family protein [Devosiaceae bacterium]
MFIEIVVVVALALLNGFLSMSELAVVSARPARLKLMASRGDKGAATAMRLAEDPGKFISSVQTGITLVGVLSGAFSGATLGQRLSAWLAASGVPNNFSDALGVGVVVVAITYISLVIGELVPKQLALRHPERISARVAPVMSGIAVVAAPIVWLLDNSGRGVLTLLGQRGETGEQVTDEEVKTIIAEAESAGVLESDERNMISGVMRFADRSARGLMTPRRDVELIDLAEPQEEILARLRDTHRSTLPVQDGDPDSIIGVIVRKDLIDVFARGEAIDVRALVKKAPVVMDRSDALSVLRAIRSSVVHMALVFDEYGHFEGIVTSGDVLEAITGALREEEGAEPAYVMREDRSWIVAGWMPVDEFSDKIGVPVSRDAKFETVAGFVLSELNHLPQVGETFTRGHWRFEVLDLDGRRIDKVLVQRI